MKYAILFAALCAASFKTNGEERKQPIVDNSTKEDTINRDWSMMSIHRADTVLLVSHISYEEIYTINEKSKGKLEPSLLVNGKLNRPIIKEIKQLRTKEAKDSLQEIVSMPFTGSKDAMTKCFDPQHAILLFTPGHIAYIDICFHCLGYTASDEFRNIEPFSKKKWMAVWSFFKSSGLTYEMPSKLGE